MLPPKKTKIIATIGPASSGEEVMRQLIQSGVNIFRFNMKHGTFEWHEKAILQSKKLAGELKLPLGILLDLQGPEVRILTKDHADLNLIANEEFILTPNTSFASQDGKFIFVSSVRVITALEVGDRFAIDDGRCICEVTKKAQEFLIAKAIDQCVLKTNESLNSIGKELNLPCLTEKDMECILFAAKVRPDFLALSYTRSKDDVLELKKHIQAAALSVKIIAKIESQMGVDKINEIIEEADGVMVARGDLGVETPIEKLTHFQKETIKKCRVRIKSVIVATQMMESMMQSTVLSRAEAADVSNAVYDGTDATMLSGETAIGKYPVLTAQTMAKILEFNEAKAEFLAIPLDASGYVQGIAKAAESISRTERIEAIIALTLSGYTAHLLSALRLKPPIIAVVSDPKVYSQLTLSYGVYPFLTELPVRDIFSYDEIVEALKIEKVIKSKDKVIITHGFSMGSPGKTNSLVIVEV